MDYVNSPLGGVESYLRCVYGEHTVRMRCVSLGTPGRHRLQGVIKLNRFVFGSPAWACRRVVLHEAGRRIGGAVEHSSADRYAFKPLRSAVNFSLARIISSQVTTPFL